MKLRGQLFDFGIQPVDLCGDMFEEHIDLVDIVAFAIDREALIVNFFGSDGHNSSLTLIQCRFLKNHDDQTYSEL